MSGFFGANETRWGGLLKQAISNVENTFDNLLEQNEPRSDGESSNLETIIDPISGIATVVPKPKRSPNSKRPDISARLAAAMAEKNNRPLAERGGRQAKANAPCLVEDNSSANDSASINSVGSAIKLIENTLENDKERPIEIASEELLLDNANKASSHDKVTENPLEIDIDETQASHKVTEASPSKSSKNIEGPVDIDEQDISSAAPAAHPKNDEIVQALQKEGVLPPTNIEAVSTLPDDEKVTLILQKREEQLLQTMTKNAELQDQMNQSVDKIHELESQLAAAKQKMLPKHVKDLEEKIEALISEGQKLSRTELRLNTTIKSLRAEKKNHDNAMTDVQKKLERVNADLQKSNTSITKANEIERRLQESVELLTGMTERQTKHINKLEENRIALEKQVSQKEAELVKTQDHLKEARAKAKSESDKAHAVMLENEIKAKRELQEKYDDLESRNRSLQAELENTESDAKATEGKLRKEISDLLNDLNQSNVRLEDFKSDGNDKTAPFLMQIEELQNQCLEAKRIQKEIEEENIALKNAHHRSSETLENARHELNNIKENMATVHSQLSVEQEERESLRSQIDNERREKIALSEKIQAFEREKEELMHQKETLKQELEKEYQKKVEKERKRWQEGMKKASAQIKANKEGQVKDTEAAQLQSMQSPTFNTRPSVDGSGSEENASAPTYRQLTNKLEFYEIQLETSGQARDELAQEMERITLEMERMKVEMDTLRKTCKKTEELEERYQASLELLGERTEEVEELKADIADVKEMYRNQIVQLVQNIEPLNKK